MRYAQHMVATQQEPLPGQVVNSAGGCSYKIDDWSQLDRFLILGTEGGSYYAGERKLTRDSAAAVLRCHAADPARCIDRIVEISETGRAPKNDAAVFALALLSTDPRACRAMPRVCRTATHLFQWIDMAQQFRGWGPSLKHAVAKWYAEKSADSLAYQVVKYRNRQGWTHRDALRLSHPKLTSPAQHAVAQFATKGMVDTTVAPNILVGYQLVQAATSVAEVVNYIADYKLPHECVPNEWFDRPEVWEAMLVHMPLHALVRNLGKMTSTGLVKPLSSAAKTIREKLSDSDYLRSSRLHPAAILMAKSIYDRGKGFKGSLSWSPVGTVSADLETAFYGSFAHAQRSGQRHLLALDVSGSMSWGTVAGTYLTPRDASAAMAMATVRLEPWTQVVAFDSTLRTLPITEQTSLSEAISIVSQGPFGATDCALPMVWALRNKLEVDAFVVYTDSETWFGSIHPSEALNRYRHQMGIDAKLIVVAMEANPFTIADPNDRGMLDVVGFDANVPQIMTEFLK